MTQLKRVHMNHVLIISNSPFSVLISQSIDGFGTYNANYNNNNNNNKRDYGVSQPSNICLEVNTLTSMESPTQTHSHAWKLNY